MAAVHVSSWLATFLVPSCLATFHVSSSQALAQKAEVRQLREACEDLEMRLTIAADESRSALIAAMGSKVDKAHLEPVVNQLLSKANLTDALAMIERKVRLFPQPCQGCGRGK